MPVSWEAHYINSANCLLEQPIKLVFAHSVRRMGAGRTGADRGGNKEVRDVGSRKN